MERRFDIGNAEYTLYQAASGDWCVTIWKAFEDADCGNYNLGALEDAYNFILKKYEILD